MMVEYKCIKCPKTFMMEKSNSGNDIDNNSNTVKSFLSEMIYKINLLKEMNDLERYMTTVSNKRTKEYTTQQKSVDGRKLINKHENILKAGVTTADVVQCMKLKKQHDLRIVNLREICFDLLSKSKNQNNIDDYDFDLLLSRIQTINDVRILNTIINNLVKSAYLNNAITDEIINDKINLSKNMIDFEYANVLEII